MGEADARRHDRAAATHSAQSSRRTRFRGFDGMRKSRFSETRKARQVECPLAGLIRTHRSQDQTVDQLARIEQDLTSKREALLTPGVASGRIYADRDLTTHHPYNVTSGRVHRTNRTLYCGRRASYQEDERPDLRGRRAGPRARP